MDRISKLPEPLQEKILLGLQSHDAIRLSFSSRQWQSLWNSIWNSLPVTAFDFNNSPDFGGISRRSRNKFVALVDDSLRTNLPEHEEQKKRIVQFCLAIETLSKKMKDSDVVDRWIKTLTKYIVTELKLEINIAPKNRYKFPPAAFDIGHLVVLKLMHCILEKDFIQESTMPFCLKELKLGHVDFNGLVVRELLSRCPSLVTLELHSCVNIKYLELSDFPNLKDVRLWNDSDIYTYKIEAPNLESLLYLEDGKPMDLEAVSCRNLKKLRIVTHGSTITSQYIKEVFFKFPLVEDLTLNARYLGSKEDVDEIKISGHHLKSLIFCGHVSNQKIINLDAPNLLSYQREDDEISSSFRLNSVKLEWANFILAGAHLNSQWFLKLREYLGRFTGCNRPSFRIYHTDQLCRTVKFSFEELQEEKLAPLPKVRQLVLIDVPSSRDYTSLIDGLLWSCHPLTISVGAYGAPNHKFIKFLYKMLMDRKEHPLCCREYHIKCWRHCLYSVKIKIRCDAEGKEDDEEVGEDREEEEEEDEDDDDDEDEDEDEDDDEDEDEDDDEDDEEVGEDREEEEEEDEDDDDDEDEDEDEDDDEDEDEDDDEDEDEEDGGDLEEEEEEEGEGSEEGAEDQGEGAGDGDGDGEEDEQEDDDGLDDGSDDAELLKTLSGLEKNYVFELQWSTLENLEEDGELDSLEIVF